MKVEWSGRFIEILTEGPWEYVRRTGDRGAAVVIAITDDDEVVLVEQYRVPLGKTCLEFPAGLIDAGETPIAAGLRELEEETGFRAAHVETIGAFASSPGLTSESFILLKAHGLVRTGPGGGLDDESITVHLVPCGEFVRFIARKRDDDVTIDVKLIAGLNLFQGLYAGQNPA